ncbi:J domain-containing protein [Olsenella massiliensis]|uniref:J domain-containing protein n=1 Tax=Olsenella massiliensis TaxID=1622075 RepID=UPI00071CB131|nr:J domain-containing protein [Olsenella massiliensis]
MRQDMTRSRAEEVLDLPERYGMADVRAAFKRLALEYHPDNAERNGISKKFAQRRMTEVNKAYAHLRSLFAETDVTLLHRYLVGAASGRRGVGVHYAPTGTTRVTTQVDDALFWDEQGNPRSAQATNAANAAADAPGHALRRLLLGPVLLRALVVLALAVVWWRLFPFVGSNAARYDLSAQAPLTELADALAAVVYPSYFVLYELVTGHVSGTLREAANGLVSLVTREHVEVHGGGAYRSDASSLVEGQVYPLLELPLAVWLLVRGMPTIEGQAQLAYLVPGALVTVDLLIGFFGSGVVMGLSRWLAALIERRYVTLRMALLKRCGQWGSAVSGRPETR